MPTCKARSPSSPQVQRRPASARRGNSSTEGMAANSPSGGTGAMDPVVTWRNLCIGLRSTAQCRLMLYVAHDKGYTGGHRLRHTNVMRLAH